MEPASRMVCLLLAAMLLLACTGCGNDRALEYLEELKEKEAAAIAADDGAEEYPDERKEKEAAVITPIVYSEKFLNIAGHTQESWIEELVDAGEGEYEDIYANDDGSVTMEIREDQRVFWQELWQDAMEWRQQRFEKLGENYKIQWSGDYGLIDLYYDLNLDAYDVVYYIVNTEAACICMQLLNGADPYDWYIEGNVYNAKTGKLVAHGTSETGLSYTEEDWKASEDPVVEEVEEEDDKVRQIVFSEKFLTFAGVDQDSWIEMLNDVGEGEYEALYASGGGSVVMELDKEQKAAWLAKIMSYLGGLQQSFAALADRYKIEYNEDFTIGWIYCDYELDIDDVAYYAGFIELYSAFVQLLNGREPDSFLVEVRVMDIETLKRVATGTTETDLIYTDVYMKGSE